MNFKILSVNGQDLSGASNEQAADAFARASEPITVMVSRIGGDGQDRTGAPDVTSSRQNDVVPSAYSPCFCRHLIECCRDDRVAPVIVSELERLRERNARKRATLSSLSDPVAHSTIGDDFDDDVFDFSYEEIVVERSASNAGKLGIVLCERPHPSTQRPQVFVNEIVAGSVADRRLSEQDRIVAINGKPVSDIDAARTLLLTGSDRAVTFVVARRLPSAKPADEPETPDDVFDDVMDHMSASPCVERRRTAGRISNPTATRDERTATVNAYDGQLSRRRSVKLNKHQHGTGTNSKKSVTPRTSRSADFPPRDETEERINLPRTRDFPNLPHTHAQDFTFVQPEDYQQPAKATTRPSRTTKHAPEDATKRSIDRSSTDSGCSLLNLRCSLAGLELGGGGDQEEEEDTSPLPLSPWVRIAQQDYENMVRDMERRERFASTNNVDSCRQHDVDMEHTLSSSSAYSTGRSSDMSPPASAPSGSGAALSSDANSDVGSCELESRTPVPLPRILNPPKPVAADDAAAAPWRHLADDAKCVRFATERRAASEWKVRVRRDGTRYVTKRRQNRVVDDVTTTTTTFPPARRQSSKQRRDGAKSQTRKMLLDGFVTVQRLIAERGENQPCGTMTTTAGDDHMLLSVAYI